MTPRDRRRGTRRVRLDASSGTLIDYAKREKNEP